MNNRLIHWAGHPAGVCIRRDNRVDEVVHRREDGSVMTRELGEAHYIENVTCTVCATAHPDARCDLAEIEEHTLHMLGLTGHADEAHNWTRLVDADPATRQAFGLDSD